MSQNPIDKLIAMHYAWAVIIIHIACEPEYGTEY